MLEENARTRAAFLAALDGVPESRIPDRWFDGWSLREIVAHVAAWEDGFATALELATRGERPVVSGFDSSEEDATNRFNARTAAAIGDTSWADLRARLDAAAVHHDAVLSTVPAHLGGDKFEERRSARRLANAANHYEEHTPAILAWREREGI